MPVVDRQSPKVQRQYEWAVAAFLRAAGKRPPFTRDEVVEAVGKLEGKYKPSSVANIFRVCKAKIPGWPEDLKYQFEKSSLTRPMATNEHVEKLVRFARLDVCDPRHRAYAFLSTIYGLRCEEISRVDSETDLDWEKGTFFAKTAKHGVQREHLLPQVAETILRGVSLRPVSEQTVGAAYRILENGAGIPHRPRFGWHAIRRALNTELLLEGKVEPFRVKKFLRWKDSDMSQHYAIFGYQADRLVLESHPFLRFWEE